jgi:mono/diheme cytochrome c family protein
MRLENVLRKQLPARHHGGHGGRGGQSLFKIGFFHRVLHVLRGGEIRSCEALYAAGSILIASLVFVQALILLSAQGKTTTDGVYTAAQATRGQKIYTDSCASCHGDDLSGGGQAPALVGKDFNMDWIDLALSDLFDRTRGTMPADKPGTLKPEEAADVIAFLLQKATFPSGQTELPADAAPLKDIKFVSPKP